MAEPIVEPVVAPVIAPVTPVVPVVAPVVAPVVEPDYFGTDGTLKEGWQGTMPEGYRDEASLKTVNDTKTLAKMFVDTKRMVGQNVMAIPTEASEQGVWDEYYKGGGRPDTVADYNLKAPDDFPQEIAEQVFPADRITKWQERFFKGGVSKKAADAFVAEFAQDMLVDYQNMQATKEHAMAELTKGLSADWGAAFEQNKHLGNMAVTEGVNGDFEFQQRLTQKFGNDPDFIRFTSNLGSKFAEGKPPGFGAIPTTADIQEQIDTITANPLYLKGTQPQRMRLAEQVMALRKKMTPEPATT